VPRILLPESGAQDAAGHWTGGVTGNGAYGHDIKLRSLIARQLPPLRGKTCRAARV